MSRLRVLLFAASLFLLTQAALPVYAQQLVAVSAENYPIADSSTAYSAAQLDQLLAPVALYPDPLIDQILEASTHPLDIVKAHHWLQNANNAALQGDSLYVALEPQSWDASVKALVATPQVLSMLNDNIDWTEALGKTYRTQPDNVMASIQRLRQLAMAEGTLTSTPEQTVSTEDDAIYIEPTGSGVVYVPTYNPALVYGVWPYAGYPPYYFVNYVSSGPVIVFSRGYTIIRYLHDRHLDRGHSHDRSHRFPDPHNRRDLQPAHTPSVTPQPQPQPRPRPLTGTLPAATPIQHPEPVRNEALVVKHIATPRLADVPRAAPLERPTLVHRKPVRAIEYRHDSERFNIASSNLPRSMPIPAQRVPSIENHPIKAHVQPVAAPRRVEPPASPQRQEAHPMGFRQNPSPAHHDDRNDRKRDNAPRN